MRVLRVGATFCVAGMLAACSELPTEVDDPTAPQFSHGPAHTSSPLYALGSPTGAPSAVMQLYTIDPASGSATLVGSTGEVGLRGLGADPTTGYLYSSYGSPQQTANTGIVRIDASTGAVTPIGGSLAFVSLSFDSGGDLYGAGHPAQGGAIIYKIDVTTGSAVQVASLTFLNALAWQIAFNSADVLYFKDWRLNIWRVDLAAGTGTHLGRVATPIAPSLSWDFDSNDNLFFADHPNDEGEEGTDEDNGWGTIDLAALTATQIGNTGIRIRGLSFLDDVPDETPPTITPTVTGTLGDNDWYTSDITVSWTVTDDESDVTVLSGCLTEVVDSDTGGVTFSCSASSEGGNADPSVTVKRDATDPTVTYTGNAGSYDISDEVAITCSASDATSGVATTTCGDITGPAYAFDLGSNTFSAIATDNAGNVGSGSTTFEVTASVEGLGALVEAFVSNAGVANSLRAKLRAAARAKNVNARNGALNAFINQVNAQSGKKVNAADADLLIALANALMG